MIHNSIIHRGLEKGLKLCSLFILVRNNNNYDPLILEVFSVTEVKNNMSNQMLRLLRCGYFVLKPRFTCYINDTGHNIVCIENAHLVRNAYISCHILRVQK